MGLATSNRLSVRAKKEAVFGTPVSASACYALRVTGEGLNFAIGTDISKEIRSDRQVTDLIITSAVADGSLPFELSYAEYDALIESVLQGVWSTFGVNGVGAVIPTSATFTANTLTAGAATSGASIFTNLVAGQWVKIAGSANPLQNIWAQVSLSVTPTSTLLTFQGTPFAAATGAGGAAVTVASSRLVNGITQTSFTVEENFGDIAQTLTFSGMTPNKMSMNLQSGSILTGSFDFMGKTMSSQAGTLLNATVTASTANQVMNSVNNILNVLEGGAALANTFIKTLTMDVMNNLRGQDGIGTLGNVGVGAGVCEVSGNINFYFADAVIYQKFLNNTNTSLSFRVNDSSLNGYVITFPNVKYSDAKIDAGAGNQDVMVTMTYKALRDTVTGSSIIIDRAGVAVLPTP